MEWWSEKKTTEGDQFFAVTTGTPPLANCCFPGVIGATSCDATGMTETDKGKGLALLDYAKAPAAASSS
jgi:hypothetical protein